MGALDQLGHRTFHPVAGRCHDGRGGYAVAVHAHPHRGLTDVRVDRRHRFVQEQRRNVRPAHAGRGGGQDLHLRVVPIHGPLLEQAGDRIRVGILHAEQASNGVRVGALRAAAEVDHLAKRPIDLLRLGLAPAQDSRAVSRVPPTVQMRTERREKRFTAPPRSQHQRPGRPFHVKLLKTFPRGIVVAANLIGRDVNACVIRQPFPELLGFPRRARYYFLSFRRVFLSIHVEPCDP